MYIHICVYIYICKVFRVRYLGLGVLGSSSGLVVWGGIAARFTKIQPGFRPNGSKTPDVAPKISARIPLPAPLPPRSVVWAALCDATRGPQHRVTHLSRPGQKLTPEPRVETYPQQLQTLGGGGSVVFLEPFGRNPRTDSQKGLQLPGSWYKC